MGDINDLLPRDRTIEVSGVTLTVKPLRLSHALELSKVGDVMQNPKDYKAEEIQQAEKQLTNLIWEVVPELKDREIGLNVLIELLGSLLSTIEPSDNRELRDRGVKFNTDPKAEENG